MTVLLTARESYLLLLFLGLVFLSIFSISRILRIAQKFNWVDTPEERSMHTTPVPSYGGVAFFLNIIIAFVVLSYFKVNSVAIVFLVSVSIIFFVGLIDDLRDWSPKRKIIFELLAILLFIVGTETYIQDLHGFLFINQLPIWLGMPLTALVILFLVQAYNLIDGIDGLASMVGMVLFTAFGFLFWFTDDYLFLGLCVTCLASLFTFLWFNISKTKRIFMGDTGSLVMGFSIGVCAIRLLTLSEVQLTHFSFEASKLPLLLIFILFVPMFDVLRVMLVRRKNGKPMFSADRNHVHHLITDRGLSHRRTSFICATINIVIVGVAFYLAQYASIELLVVDLIMTITVVNLLLFRINRNFYAKRTKVGVRRVLEKVLKVNRVSGLYRMFF